ncbi:MAG: hypothetical protein QG626_268 [Patescibacteria group bacterium]|jgi:hypothetical protein|nr:hypothetical protein [Patescibacteria group bacterium]
MRILRLRILAYVCLLSLSLFLWSPAFVQAETSAPQVNLFFSPSTQSVIEGSTFQVSLYLDTKGQSMSTMELNVKYPQDLMEIVTPSAGQSLIQLWLQPPTYSNTEGTAHLVGLIPNGVVTESGLITTMTFRALSSGKGEITLQSNSQILANDGLGTAAQASFGRATYTITPKPPAGARVFSPTHPFETNWYKERNTVIGWDQDPAVDGFSFSLNTEPSSIPDEISEGTGTVANFEGLTDGLHYFHIRASKQGVWGPTTHFLLRIDSLLPAAFKPTVDVVQGDDTERRLVSFFTTDSLSGIDHYEVGIIDKTESPDLSPVFVQAESPFQFTADPTHKYRVVVRAVDASGNVRDESVDLRATLYVSAFAWARAMAQDYLFIVLSALLALLIAMITAHYLVGHHIYRRLRALGHLLTHGDELAQMERNLASDKHARSVHSRHGV